MQVTLFWSKLRIIFLVLCPSWVPLNNICKALFYLDSHLLNKHLYAKMTQKIQNKGKLESWQFYSNTLLSIILWGFSCSTGQRAETRKSRGHLGEQREWANLCLWHRLHWRDVQQQPVKEGLVLQGTPQLVLFCLKWKQESALFFRRLNTEQRSNLAVWLVSCFLVLCRQAVEDSFALGS